MVPQTSEGRYEQVVGQEIKRKRVNTGATDVVSASGNSACYQWTSPGGIKMWERGREMSASSCTSGAEDVQNGCGRVKRSREETPRLKETGAFHTTPRCKQDGASWRKRDGRCTCIRVRCKAAARCVSSNQSSKNTGGEEGGGEVGGRGGITWQGYNPTTLLIQC
jgi:hypothetical protein